jgi:hypothetical protein
VPRRVGEALPVGGLSVTTGISRPGTSSITASASRITPSPANAGVRRFEDALDSDAAGGDMTATFRRIRPMSSVRWV